MKGYSLGCLRLVIFGPDSAIREELSRYFVRG